MIFQFEVGGFVAESALLDIARAIARADMGFALVEDDVGPAGDPTADPADPSAIREVVRRHFDGKRYRVALIASGPDAEGVDLEGLKRHVDACGGQWLHVREPGWGSDGKFAPGRAALGVGGSERLECEILDGGEKFRAICPPDAEGRQREAAKRIDALLKRSGMLFRP